jgi:diacylglycerol kinase family enzyme
MDALLIVNPHATSTTERRRDLLAHALAAEIDLTVEHTAARGHAADLAAKAAEDRVDLVVVHGGDGTVNEVVNGLLSGGARTESPMLAIVPGGSTNVFARAIGVAADPTAATEQILQALATATPPRTVSLGKAGDRYFTFNAGIGIDADVVERVEQRRAAGAKVTAGLHVRQAVGAWFGSDRKIGHLTLDIPGRDPVIGCHLVFVSNVDPWTYLGSRPIRTNPGTSAEGGLGVFAALSLHAPAVARMAGQLLVPNSRKGPHGRRLLRLDDVQSLTVTADEPVGLQLDGDFVGRWSPVQFRSVPDALRVLV